MQFDFDRVINREGSDSVKFDARRAVFGKADVIPLWVADMDFAAPPAVTDALTRRAAHPLYGYTLFPDTLYRACQDWFEHRHGWSIKRRDLLMCPGVVPSIHAVLTALTGPGDQIIVQPPVYFPFFEVVRDSGRELVNNPLKVEQGEYRFDFEHLEQCLEAGARWLVLCSPHNPVGRVWHQHELEQLLALARRYELNIISDEIHADLVYEGVEHTPLATLSDEVNIITTVSASKTFNIAGLGLSALVVPDKKQRQVIKKVFDEAHISAANPFSITATLTAYQQGEAWLDAMMAYVADNYQWVSRFFADNCPLIQPFRPEGTYLLWLDCRQMQLDDDALKSFFVDKAGVGMNPGISFGDVGSGFMRMNLATPRSVLGQACRQIASAFNQS